jgi:hypothetical protein
MGKLSRDLSNLFGAPALAQLPVPPARSHRESKPEAMERSGLLEGQVRLQSGDPMCGERGGAVRVVHEAWPEYEHEIEHAGFHNPHDSLLPLSALCCQGLRGLPLDMSGMRPECPDSDPSDRSVDADVLLRQEPEEEEEEKEEEEDEGDGKEDDDDDGKDDDGYSE